MGKTAEGATLETGQEVSSDQNGGSQRCEKWLESGYFCRQRRVNVESKREYKDDFRRLGLGNWTELPSVRWRGYGRSRFEG